MDKSEVYFWALLFFLLGVFFASLLYFLNFPLKFLFFVLFLFLPISFLPEKKKFLFFFCLSFFLVGFFYFYFFAFWRFSSDLLYQVQKDNPKNSFGFLGAVFSEPYLKDNCQFFLLEVLSPKTDTKILVKASPLLNISFGEVVNFYGSLKEIDNPYYFKKNVFLESNFPRIEKVSQRKYLFKRKLFALRKRMEEKLSFLFSEPSFSFFDGLLFGQKKEMPKNFKKMLNSAGVSHLVALSGYHIGVFSFYLMSFLIFLAFSRSTAFYISLFFVFLFVIMTGASSSCLRASLMASIFLFAQKSSRLTSKKQLLISVAFLLALANPKIIFFDLGFQLSFLAVLGLFYLFPVLKRYLEEFFSKRKMLFFRKASFFRENVLVTISAQAMVLPLIALNFKSIPLTGVLSNCLILPLIPLTMLLVFLTLLVSFFSLKLALIISFLINPLWQYLEMVVSFFAKFSFSFSFPSYLMVFLVFLYYFFLFLFLKKGQKVD